ncbi:ABC transporter permease [Noviherbaspirillum denitrificans]|uniref:ABC transporter permease n=1 Tax=Noviherbaspirillum denitrificans TaxID=1968433 RepID=A0A254TE43_9BURK|nr:FtsX-like permease family protein [Noviherbaspirillum denitrificans]OWW20929.1 ABC transporter permease [Noviherbaspirillum denitrificans]
MNTLSLALRNLLRNRRRSLTTLLAMIVGLVAILLFGGYSRNVILAMQTGYVQVHGHYQIQRKDYFLYGSGNPAAYGIPDYERVIETVKRDPVLAPLLTVVTPKMQLGGIAGNFAAGVSKTVIGSGVVVDDQNRMRAWDDYGSMSYSRPLALTGTAQDAVVIGQGVARILQLCGPLEVPNCPQQAKKAEAAGPQAPDDITALSTLEKPAEAQAGGTAIELLAANLHGAPNVGRLNVVKAENQGLKEVDDMFMVMHLPQAQRLIYGGEKPQVTAIQLQLQHTSQMPAAKARLEELLATTFKDAQLEIQAFQTLAPIYGQTIQFFNSVFGFISILIGVIVLFTVGNTMSMAVVERTVEIGTLRAIGRRRGGIRGMFVCEGLLLGVIGSLLGVAIALLFSMLINNSGLTWTPPGYVYAYPVKTRVWGETGLILGSVIGMVVVAVVSAWWPASRASKMVIVDALRHV